MTDPPMGGQLGQTIVEKVCPACYAEWVGQQVLYINHYGLQMADPDDRKKLFAQHVLAYVPLAQHIRRVLDERSTHVAPASRFRNELEDHMSEEAADQTLRTVTSWARYGEVFAYDEATGVFSLDNPS